jgi:hypothetical protein
MMDVGLAVSYPLARCRRAPIRSLFIGSRLRSTLLADSRLAKTPLRIAITHLHQVVKRALHLQAVNHARHTKRASVLPMVVVGQKRK